ncbi:MAG: Gfo/Idh/MocA family oxidoreductase [Gemmatimonadota bacterium]|nr:Gfo/Idh/MocA family oxidoreductase [Gemmatimonadota bacterium]
MTDAPRTRALEVGLVGFGLGGGSFHAPLIAATAGLRLAAVVTRNAERRHEVGRLYPEAHVLSSAVELWAMKPQLDLVVVSTPNATHVPLAHAVLESGAHVVVDKPFAPTADEARAIGALAERVSRLAIPYQNRRWDGDFLTVQRLLRESRFGDVMRFESRFERWRAAPKPGWITPDAGTRAEGVVYDLGTHLIDQALVLWGPVTTVYAELEKRHPDVHVEDEAFISLLHTSGVRSHLYTSMAAAQSGARMSVWGTRGAYVKHGLDVQEAALRAGARPGGPSWGVEERDHWGWFGMAEERRHEPTEPGAYPAFYAGVECAIRTGAPPPVSVAEAVASLTVVEAALRSGRERTPVTL